MSKEKKYNGIASQFPCFKGEKQTQVGTRMLESYAEEFKIELENLRKSFLSKKAMELVFKDNKNFSSKHGLE